MPAGEAFSSAERAALDASIRKAELTSRVEFSVYVGAFEGTPRDFATSLHNTLVAPTRSVMIAVDPEQRLLEIVTGGWVRRTLSDAEAQLAAETMRASFAEEDLLGGLQRGIAQLAEHARG